MKGIIFAGDVRHSQAATDKAQLLLGYADAHPLCDGIRDAMPWYVRLINGASS